MSEESTARNLEQRILVGKPKVLEGHTRGVNSVVVKDNLIISGSYDKTICIWDINTGDCLKVLGGHTDLIMSVFVKDNLIISGSNDNTIHIWDINTGGCLKVLEGHTDSVWSVFVKDNLIISGSDDATIRITPITLFPGELEVFQSVIDEYWLARNLEQELLGYFGC